MFEPYLDLELNKTNIYKQKMYKDNWRILTLTRYLILLNTIVNAEEFRTLLQRPWEKIMVTSEQDCKEYNLKNNWTYQQRAL